MEKFELIKVVGGWGIENSVSGEVQSVHESLQEAMNSIDVDCWFVADGFVMEPSLGGQMVEEAWDQIAPGSRVLCINEEIFDAAQEEFKAENGHYPDE
jgi:hypothetical protein